MDSQVYGPVLLVCIYNKYGNILTHDYFYQMFGQYGEIVKILIFEKAKVWKTFIQFTNMPSAKNALINLNNRVVFQDGSKMNIFSSKLQHIKFQNANLGGVNYEELKNDTNFLVNDHPINRGRRSTLQQPSTIPIELQTYNYFNSNSSFNDKNKSLKEQQQSTHSFVDRGSDSFSGHKSYKSSNTFDIDEQFLELARQSEEFRELQKQVIRKKSKTIVSNPHLQQFVIENSPSKVLFIRSIPEYYTNKCLFNIFNNFGSVLRIIYMNEKNSGLIEFQSLDQAIFAKDELNYVKPPMKVFYSHYENLELKEGQEKQTLQDFEQYKSVSSKVSFDKRKNNPPSQTLYITHFHPKGEAELLEKCQQIQCPIQDIQCKKKEQQKWMCLAKFGNIEKSLKVMGLLQGHKFSKGRQIKLSFTRSKIPKQSPKKYREADNSSM